MRMLWIVWSAQLKPWHLRVKVIMKTSTLTAWPMLGLGGCIEFALNICPDYVPKLCAHETKCSGTLWQMWIWHFIANYAIYVPVSHIIWKVLSIGNRIFNAFGYNINSAHTKASIWRTEQSKVTSNTKILTSSIFSICFSSSYSSLQSKRLDPISKVETQNCYGARCHQVWPSTVEMHYMLYIQRPDLAWKSLFRGIALFRS